jgi:protein translocase SecG subunit
MNTLLLIIMLLSWALMTFAILLMAPKGWLGFGLGGFAGNNEYGTTKSLETGLKKLATITSIIFVITALIYPFTKERTYFPDSIANSGAVAPAFDLGWSAATGDDSISTWSKIIPASTGASN